MEKLQHLKNALKANVQTPFCLFWSGGIDSTLLLAVLREADYKFDIFQARELWTREQKKKADDLIKKWNLQVFSYSPSAAYFVGQAKEVSVVFEYLVGQSRIPLVRDVIGGENCAADIAFLPKTSFAPVWWGLHVVGSRKDDRHYTARGEILPAARFENAGAEFYAPLWDWTREEVKQASEIYSLPTREVPEVEDTGNAAICRNCLNGTGKVFCPKENTQIDSVIWDREVNLEAFRQKFNL